MDQSKYQSLNRDSLNPFKGGGATDTAGKDNHNDSSNFDTQRSDTVTPVVDNSVFNSHNHPESPQNIINNNSIIGGIGMSHSKSDLPYSEAIKCIEKI